MSELDSKNLNKTNLSKSALKLVANKSDINIWSKRKHLLDTDDLSQDEILSLVRQAKICKEILEIKDPPQAILSNKTIANLFYENSTRTRSSFELASKKLGASVINLEIMSSSVAKGESLVDTAKTFISMGVDAIVQRHPASGSAFQIAQYLGNKVTVINAGDGWHAHPTQALLDFFTIWQKIPNLAGLKIAIIGDILHSRVARSNFWLLKTMGADIHVAGPPTLLPKELDRLGITTHTRLEPAIENADIIMVLRLQLERQKQGLIPSIGEYKRLYRLDHTKLKHASSSVHVLHPGPINQDLEITSSLSQDTDISLISEQVTNGVAVRMASLYLLLS